jgi:hypothetical protein
MFSLICGWKIENRLLGDGKGSGLGRGEGKAKEGSREYGYSQTMICE